jgi:ankyrin repeat protein
MVEFLLAHGANVNKNFEDGCLFGFTPVRSATKVGNIEAMKLLLRHGADPTKEYYTALHDAAYYGHYEAANLLLKYQTNIDYMKIGDMGASISSLGGLNSGRRI